MKCQGCGEFFLLSDKGFDPINCMCAKCKEDLTNRKTRKILQPVQVGRS
jgi:hypothetical protein